MTQQCTIPTPLGPMLAAASDEALTSLDFTEPADHAARLGRSSEHVPANLTHPILRSLVRELTEYFTADRRTFTIPLAPQGTDFDRRAWDALLAIPFGQTRSYLQQARALGQPTATRAVARANGRNPIAILIPCHRVIGADGTLTGYGGGLHRKQWLIDHERAAIAEHLFAAPARA